MRFSDSSRAGRLASEWEPGTTAKEGREGERGGGGRGREEEGKKEVSDPEAEGEGEGEGGRGGRVTARAEAARARTRARVDARAHVRGRRASQASPVFAATAALSMASVPPPPALRLLSVPGRRILFLGQLLLKILCIRGGHPQDT